MPVHAAVDVLDLPPEQVLTLQSVVDDREGGTLIVVDGLSVPGAPTEALVDGIEYIHRSFHGEARVLTGDGVEYIYASGDSAIKVLAVTEQDVLDFLGRLP